MHKVDLYLNMIDKMCQVEEETVTEGRQYLQDLKSKPIGKYSTRLIKAN